MENNNLLPQNVKVYNVKTSHKLADGTIRYYDTTRVYTPRPRQPRPAVPAETVAAIMADYRNEVKIKAICQRYNMSYAKVRRVIDENTNNAAAPEHQPAA